MTKIFTLAAFVCFSVSAFAQTFSDNFETYAVGDYIGQQSPNWTTWSGATGGALDCQVVSDQSVSGSKSIYLFNATAAGGPMDIVLPFGGAYNLGQFSYEMQLRVEDGKGGYFNFQKETTIGTTWAMECWFNQDGNMKILASGAEVLLTTFEHDTWFNLRIDVDFNTNTWELFIDNDSRGNWSNTENQLASINLYPSNNTNQGGNESSGFYVDDVSYTVTPYTVGGLNGTITDINLHTGLADVDSKPTVTIRNLGTTAITSFDLQVQQGTSSVSQSFSSYNIASLQSAKIKLNNAISLSAGGNTLMATISNINGMAQDDNPSDDVKTKTISLVTPANDKMVIVEEATGTWCQWCPRGAVMLDSLTKRYPDHLIGIAVHNGDPMVYTEYDDGIGDFVGGYPSIVTNRDVELDPLGMEGSFLSYVDDAPAGVLAIGAEQNGATTTFSISTEWLVPTGPGWKVALVLTEDDLSGTTAQWAQSNAYAGGGNGVMGGYELLPTPVPAAQMVYDHVGRIIVPSFTGYGDHFTESAIMPVGTIKTLNIDMDMDPAWDEGNMHVIAILFNAAGTIDNAMQVTFLEAIANGLTIGEPVGLPQQVLSHNLGMDLFPNPASGMTYMSVTTELPEEMNMTITDVNGRLVGQRNYGMLSGTFQLPIAVDQLESGIYIVTLTTGTEQRVRKLVVE